MAPEIQVDYVLQHVLVEGLHPPTILLEPPAETIVKIVVDSGSGGGGGGTVTGAANVGTGGVGPFKQLNGTVLEFRNINGAPGGKVTVALDGPNNEIDVDVADASETQKGAVELAANGESAALLAVQANDARLSDARTPTAHAASHQHLGTDEIAVASPTSNGIPKAGAVGQLDPGWLPDATAVAKGVIQLTGDFAGTAASPSVTNNAITFAKMQDIAGFSVIGKSDTGNGDPTNIIAADETVLGRTAGGNLVFAQIATGQLGNNVVTFLKMQDIAGFSVIGKSDTGTGDPTNVTAGTDTVLGRNGSGNLVFAQLVNGQITNSTIANAKLATMPANRIKGNNTGGATNPLDLTGTQVTAMLDSFAGGNPGLVPISSGNPTDTLHSDGTWSTDVFTPGTFVTVNGVGPIGDADFDDAIPAAPASSVNVRWQKDALVPNNISANIQIDTANKVAGLDGNNRVNRPAKALFDGVSTDLTSAGIADGGLLARSGSSIISLPAIGTYILDASNTVTSAHIAANAVTFPKAQVALMSALSLRF